MEIEAPAIGGAVDAPPIDATPEAAAAAEPEPEADPLSADDPLSSAATDPLSEAAGSVPLPDTFGGAGAADVYETYEEGFTPWAERRDMILTEYQTDKSITIANLKNIDNTDDAAEAMAAAASVPQSRKRTGATRRCL